MVWILIIPTVAGIRLGSESESSSSSPVGPFTITLKGVHGCQEKKLVATRHAQAAHNVCEDKVKKKAGLAGLPAELASAIQAAGTDEKKALKACLNYKGYLDAQLSPKGVDDVFSRGRIMMMEAMKAAGSEPAVVFVSPLRRALTTAAILYHNYARPLYAFDLVVEKRTGGPADSRRHVKDVLSKLDLVDEAAPGSPKAKELFGTSTVRIATGGNAYEDVQIHDNKPKKVGPDVLAKLPHPVTGSFVSDEYYFHETPEDDSGTDKRALELLRYVASLPSADFPVVGVVSHKGFLREMELMAGLYNDLDGMPPGAAPNPAQAQSLRTKIKAIKDKAAAREASHLPGGEYPNAHTRVYHLKCQK